MGKALSQQQIKGTAERDKSHQNFSDILYHGEKTKRDY